MVNDTDQNSAMRVILLLLITSSHIQMEEKKTQPPQLDRPHNTSCLCNIPLACGNCKRCTFLNWLSSTLSCWRQGSLLGFSSFGSLLPLWGHLLGGRWIFFSSPSLTIPFLQSLCLFFASSPPEQVLAICFRDHICLLNLSCTSFRLQHSDFYPQNSQYIGQSLKYSEISTTLTAVFWGCFLLALNTCAWFLQHCNPHAF